MKLAKLKNFLLMLCSMLLSKMDDLRYWMYHFCKSHDFDKIPPTSHLTVSHIKRAFYVTHDIITVFDNEASLDPTNFGFQIESGYLIPQKDLRLWPNDLVKECHCISCYRGATCICRSNNLFAYHFVSVKVIRLYHAKIH